MPARRAINQKRCTTCVSLQSIRYRLARLYQDAGEDAKALEQLKQIKTYRMKQVEFEMGVLEKRLGARKQ
jgi:hypothetical protein